VGAPLFSTLFSTPISTRISTPISTLIPRTDARRQRAGLRAAVLSYSVWRDAPMPRIAPDFYSGRMNSELAEDASETPLEEDRMLKWALIFAVIAAVAGLFGFTGIASGAAGIAKILFIVFLVLFVVVVLLALLGIGAVS
jgi:uncharacterized membrane protein YtjA (UPF0391 family)